MKLLDSCISPRSFQVGPASGCNHTHGMEKALQGSEDLSRPRFPTKGGNTSDASEIDMVMVGNEFTAIFELSGQRSIGSGAAC